MSEMGAAASAGSDWGGAASGLGGAVSGVFAGLAAGASEAGYEAQEKFDKRAAATEQQILGLQLHQQDRQMYNVLGGQKADVAASGFLESGSALSLLRDSAIQGEITRGVTEKQGNLQIANYRTQAQIAGDEADAAQTSEIGSFVGAGLSLLSGAMAL